MDGRWRHFEKFLEVGFRGRSPVQLRVRHDVRQVLALDTLVWGENFSNPLFFGALLLPSWPNPSLQFFEPIEHDVNLGRC